MKRILKNNSRNVVNTNVKGKVYVIKSKGSLTIEDNQAGEISENLLQRYGFLIDVTDLMAAREAKPVVSKSQSKRIKIVQEAKLKEPKKTVTKKSKGVTRK